MRMQWRVPRRVASRRKQAVLAVSLVAAAAANFLGVFGRRGAPGAFATQLGGNRRAAVLGASIAGAGWGFGSRPVGAFAGDEETRIAKYGEQAKLMNQATDWYLFEVRPLVFPSKELLEVSDCERDGNACPELAGLAKVSELYQTVGQSRSGQVTLSKLDRDFFAPMKTLALAAFFDPDTSDDLDAKNLKFEKVSMELGRAARRGDVKLVRQKYDEGIDILNDFFNTVNTATGLPSTAESYITPLPRDGDTLQEKYWQRREQKYIVKKKVDAVSKGNKSARFYAKSIFGDDAVSWDTRGDRAPEYWK